LDLFEDTLRARADLVRSACGKAVGAAVPTAFKNREYSQVRDRHELFARWSPP
jgi:hypothetical protein